MAFRVELDKALLLTALEKELASQKRLRNTTKQLQFVPIIEKDIAAFQAAIGGLTEIK
jgi:hypothetical protein